jgi:hypothetical protein
MFPGAGVAEVMPSVTSHQKLSARIIRGIMSGKPLTALTTHLSPKCSAIFSKIAKQSYTTVLFLMTGTLQHGLMRSSFKEERITG